MKKVSQLIEELSIMTFGVFGSLVLLLILHFTS